MTVLDKFIAYAKALPEGDREAMEESLAALMDSWSAEYEFTQDELSELDRRIAQPNPAYSDPTAITRIFGKPFRT